MSLWLVPLLLRKLRVRIAGFGWHDQRDPEMLAWFQCGERAAEPSLFWECSLSQGAELRAMAARRS